LLKLAAIVGPTAVGKTALSIAVAKELNAEIISCDSMQVYKGMDIGTAKVTRAEKEQVPHHLIDLLEPDVPFTVAEYQRLVKKKISNLNQEGKLPLLVGGTGLYYQAVVDDYTFFPMETQTAVRRKWEDLCQEKGLDFIFQQLIAVDPEYAQKVGSNDRKRIIRAMEVWELTGEPFSNFQIRNENAYNLKVVGLFLERAELYRRIDQRVDQMFADGLLQEVINLRKKGYDLSLNSMNSLGYKQVQFYLQGMLTEEEMIREIKRETRHFAKRQYTWFNKDRRIQWINVGEICDRSQLLAIVKSVLEVQIQEA